VPDYSEEDFQNEEDQLVSLEEESPDSEHSYLASSLSMPSATMAEMSGGMNGMHALMHGTSMSMGGGGGHMIAAQNY